MRFSGWALAPATVSLLLLPAPGGADEVHLTSGGVVRGVIVEQSDETVVLETGPGRVTLHRSRIARVIEGSSPLESFHERAARVPPGDVEALARLARWAEEQALATQARETWRRVLRLDPDHPDANAALGRVPLDGVWMDEAEAYRARGYVRYRGRWVTPSEREVLVRQEEGEALSASVQREAELRVREAEARAREAEARAREAEARADQTEGSGEGIPYWWVLAGGGPPFWPPGGHSPRPPLVLPEHPIARPPRVEPPRSDSSTGSIRGNPTRNPPPLGGPSRAPSSSSPRVGAGRPTGATGRH
jgi:hypothetical protein